MKQPLCLGLITPWITGSSFGFELICGAHAAAREAGYRLLVVESLAEQIAESQVAEDLVDGWIVLVDSRGVGALAARGKPVVTVSTQVSDPPLPSVFPDNLGGIRQVVQHLIEAGHRQIAWAGYLGNADHVERLAGLRAELGRAGIELDPDLVINTEGYFEHHGYAAAQRLLSSGKPFSAILAGLDWNALGILDALKDAGKRVPQDVALIGWDDDVRATLSTPPLSSVRQYPERMGQEAVRLLIAQVRGEVVDPAPHLVPVRLMVRESSGQAAGKTIGPHLGGSLAHALVGYLLAPFALAPEMSPAAIWPSVGLLADEPGQILVGSAPPSPRRLTGLWREALARTQDVDLLLGIIDLAERHFTAERDWAAREVIGAYFSQVRGALTRAFALHFTHKDGQHNSLVANHRSMSARLFSAALSWPQIEDADAPAHADLPSTDLGWLHESRARWAMLASWEGQGPGRRSLRVRGDFWRNGATAERLLRVEPEGFPLRALPAGQPFAQPDEIVRMISVRSSQANLGLMVYCEQLSTIDHDSVIMSALLLGAILERTLLIDSLRKAKEEAEAARRVAEAASTAKSTFLANMSHELRSPLNAIINFTKFLEKPRYGSLSPRQAELQARIIANADHLLGLINDVLDLSKIDSGRLDLVIEAVDLRPIIQEVMDTASGLARDKPISLRSELPEALPPVMADRTRVRQVLLNLLSNAAKFTERGSIVLRARQLAGALEVAVADTGIGIAPAHQELVFEEFRQVEDSFTRQYQGTGLGLPICRRLVQMHGGRLWLQSSLGQGSTFFFTLPVAGDQPA